MKITAIKLYAADLPMKEGAYSWAGQSFASFDSTIVRIETDEGLVGVGEVCPLGPAYIPGFAEGVRAGIGVLAPQLVGVDPCNLGALNAFMDLRLKGHPYIKSAIDIACHDIKGQALGVPVYDLLGGKRQDKVKLFKVISRADPSQMAERIAAYQEQGFHQFQMKVGAGADEDIQRIHAVMGAKNDGVKIAADANCGWKLHEAIRVTNAVRDLDLYIEQPCETYRECLAVRRNAPHPMILDECMVDVAALMTAIQDRACEAINLKVSRYGGLTKSRLIRDLCLDAGLMMTIEDTWGGDIGDAVIAHLAHTVPSDMHFQSSAFHEYTNARHATGAPTIKDGYMSVTDAPGLGLAVDWPALGEPIAVIS